MSETFAEEVEREITRRRGSSSARRVIFRTFALLATGILITFGLSANGVAASYLFGIATILALIWLREKKSTQ